MPGFPQHGGGSGGGVWTLVGATIEATPAADYNLTNGLGTVGAFGSLAWGGGDAPGTYATAVSQGLASSTLDFAAGAGSTADSASGSTGSAALAGGYIFGADASFAAGVGSAVHAPNSVALATGVTFGGSDCVAMAGGYAYSNFDVAIGVGSIADSFGGSIGSVALAGGNTTTDAAFAVGAGSVAAAPNSVAIAGGMTSSQNDFAVGYLATVDGDGVYGSVCFSDSEVTGGVANAFATSGGMCTADNAVAFSGVSSGDSAFSAANGLSTGNFSAALSDGTANGLYATALSGGTANDNVDFAVGPTSIASGGYVLGTVAMAGGATTNDGSVAIGPSTAVSGWKIGDDAGSLFSANDDGAGSTLIQMGTTANLELAGVATSTAVGAPGAAAPLPALPSLYLVLTVNGTQYNFPGYAHV